MHNKSAIIKLITIVSLVMLLSACQSRPSRSPVVTPQKMMCDSVNPAQITLYSPELAVLIYGGKKYELERTQSASGVKYSNRSIEYWNKGVDAMITRKDGTVTNCLFLPKSGI